MRTLPVVLVFVGGFAGTAARYSLEQVHPAEPGAWPVTTFAINTAGALVLGMLLEGLARRGPDEGGRRRLRLLLGTGFCGGFTTYSTLALETDHLFRTGHAGPGVAYPALSLLCGVLVAALGVRLAAGLRA